MFCLYAFWGSPVSCITHRKYRSSAIFHNFSWHKSTIDPLQTNLIKLWETEALLYFRYIIHEPGKPVAPRKSKQSKRHPPGLGYIVDVLILDPSGKRKNIFFYSIHTIKYKPTYILGPLQSPLTHANS